MAIGGTLSDGTPGESGPVAGHSYVYQIATGDTFHWQNGVTTGQTLPVNMQDYAYLLSVVQQAVVDDAGIWVVDQGGCYDESNAALRYFDLYDFAYNAQPQQANGRRIVVFIGEGTVGIKGTVDNRQFGMSIMAPKAHVVIDESVGYVDGCIVAKSLTMTGSQGSNGAGVQVHCNCFNMPLHCPEGTAPPPPPCFDTLPQDSCDRLVSRGKCGRADALSGCRKSCGHCGGCPARRAPPPPGGGAFAYCAFPSQVSSYALITYGDTSLGSHSHYKGIAVGGALIDSTPNQFGTVSAKSFVTDIGSAGASFTWADGVTTGQPLPFDWTQFQRLADRVRPSSSITVIDQGGYYDPSARGTEYSMDTLCDTTSVNRLANICQSGASGTSLLVVFRGKGTISLVGTLNARAWQPTILAPYAHVRAESSTDYVDGVIIARSFDSVPGMDQMHAYLYNGPMLCEEGPLPGTTCSDTREEQYCSRKLAKGKCDNGGVRSKCAQTCGVCQTMG